ncbi:MAG: hypothetical protein NTV34_15620 [Proteobacteria bacterium]|nr:hypothetical protein [Pseudomonadota bacterium]
MKRELGVTILLFTISVAANVLNIASEASGQTRSRGPGTGPPIAGSGKSIFTYPQPPKPTVYSPTSIRPAYQVPENAEKSVWRLTSKVDGRDPPRPTTDVPVYSFSSGGARYQAGTAKTGEELVMDEIRPLGKATYYKFAWTGSTNKSTAGPNQEYWVSGSNVEYAGKK